MVLRFPNYRGGPLQRGRLTGALASEFFSAGPTNAQTISSRETTSTAQIDAYMGAPVEMATAPNGAITRKKLLDGIGKVGWVEPTIEQPAEGIWVFGGYGLAPVTVIDTDEGLIAFDTGDTTLARLLGH